MLIKTADAKQKNLDAEIEEQIKLAAASAQLKGNGFLTEENLNSELQSLFNNEEMVIEAPEYYTYKASKIYRIYKDGKVQEGKLLPDEYHQVEYLESNGKQYINTNKLNNFQNIKISYKRTNTGGDDGILIGSRSGWCSKDFSVWTNYNKGTLAFHVMKNENNTNKYIDTGWIYNNSPLDKHILLIENGNIYVDNQKIYSFEASNRNCECYMYIFTLNEANKPDSRMFIGRVYNVVMYDNDLKEIWNGIPCLDNLGRPCLYDIISNTSFYNQGEGEFIAGPEV